MDTNGHTILCEDYVSFEVAKLLKEKGFNGKCSRWYVANEPQEGIVEKGFGENQFYINAPTLQMTMKWLREVHGIFIAINNDDLDFNWQCYDLINRGSTLDPKILSESYAGYKTYEKAVEAALKYVLKNLI